AQIPRAVQRADRDRLQRRESGLHEKLDLPLVREAGNHAARSGRIGTGDEQAPGFRKRAFERHAFGKQHLVDRLLVLRDSLKRLIELLLELRQKDFRTWWSWTARSECLEHGQRRSQRHLAVDEV